MMANIYLDMSVEGRVSERVGGTDSGRSDEGPNAERLELGGMEKD